MKFTFFLKALDQKSSVLFHVVLQRELDSLADLKHKRNIYKQTQTSNILVFNNVHYIRQRKGFRVFSLFACSSWEVILAFTHLSTQLIAQIPWE